MSPDEIAKTTTSPWFKGVRKNHRGTQQSFTLCGFDTETCYGEVFAFGFFDGTTTTITHGKNRDFLRDFISCLKKLNHSRSTIVCVAHYLVFDLGVLLFHTLNPLGTRQKRAPKNSHFCLLSDRTEIFVAWGKPCFARIRFGKHTVHVIDTFAFYGVSLDYALKTIGAPVQKMAKPHLLGKRIIPRKEVEPYLTADVQGVYELGLHVLALHKRYSAALCVSLPQLAGRIFRHAYMEKNFVRLPAPVLLGAMYSYHGGKNTFVGKGGWYPNCYDLDIRSAFPQAMQDLPNFENGRWERCDNLKTALANRHGVYRVYGVVRACPWGSLFSHEFKKLTGEFTGVWVTGYELIEAHKSGELKNVRDIRGYYFVDLGGTSAFGRFVDDFFRLKETATNSVDRQFYKLILNSLYGKFIQRNELDNGDKQVGSMFDPVVASLITGFVRARIHQLEHKYKSLHTATDGLLTLKKPDALDLGDSIGTLKQENFGPCLIIRNKLYIHYDLKGNVFKRGLHGYQGTGEELLKMYKSKKTEYTVEKLVGWAESFHIGLPPGFPRTKTMKLNIDYSKQNNGERNGRKPGKTSSLNS